jgi:hypothetical protein
VGQTPDPQSLGKKEGIQAIGLAGIGRDPLESWHHSRIEYRDTVVDLHEDWGLV